MDNLLQIGIVLTAIDKMSGVLTGAAEKATQGFARLQQKIKAVSATMTEMGTKATLMGHGILSAMETPVKAFADLDEASTDLRVAMMNNFGKIPPQIAEITKQAVELGNVLPGTTADFTNAGAALIETGTSIDTTLNGGLKAASYLSVILKQPPKDVAEMISKFREAFGLADDELTKMADLTQKAKFAFGLTGEEIKYATQYDATKLRILGLTGAENAKIMLAFQGYARQRGTEGSVFGTHFAQLLSRTADLQQRLMKHSPVMKEVNRNLEKYGINLQFFDKAGNFKGLEAMVGQLEKLRVLTQHEKELTLKGIFGDVGMDAAFFAMDMGVAGLREQIGKMDKQADIMQRIDVITKSAKNTWEALTGTITNFWAAVGEPMVTSLYPLIQKANEFVGGPLMDWVAQHKELVKWLGLGTAALGVLLVALGGLGIVAGAVGAGLAAVVGVIGALFSPVTLIVAVIAAGAALIIANWKPLKAYFSGFWMGFKKGLSPIMPYLDKIGAKFSWLADKAKAAGQWIWKNFMPNTLHGASSKEDYSDSHDRWHRKRSTVGKGFDAGNDYGTNFSNNISDLMHGVQDGIDRFNKFREFLKSIPEEASKSWDSGLGKCSAAIDKFLNALHDVQYKIKQDWDNMFDSLKSLRARIENFLSDLVKKFFDFGAAMLDMLVAGIKSKVNAVIDTVSGLTERIRGFFNHSPAKEGALKDIHQHTLSEMVASAIKPEPVVRALQAMTAAGLMALAPLTNPVVALATATPPAMASHGTGLSQPALMLPALAKLSAMPAMPAPAVMPTMPPLSLPLPPAPKPAPRLAPSAATQSGAAAPVTVHFSPTITVQGGSGTTKDDIMAALKKHEHELVQLIEQVMARNARRQY